MGASLLFAAMAAAQSAVPAPPHASMARVDPMHPTSTRATQMTGRAAADIASLIMRQVQPCARRAALPAPEARQIITTIRLQLARDGSLAADPVVVSQTNVTDSNRAHARTVADSAIHAFRQCSPLRGLPDQLYDVPRGWRTLTLRFRFPG